MLTLLKSKIDSEVESHFEFEYEENKQEYECIFKFQGYEITVPYDVSTSFIYKNQWISAEKNDKIYCDEDKDYFQISNKNYDPNKKSLSEIISQIIEHENRKASERDIYDWNKGVIL